MLKFILFGFILLFFGTRMQAQNSLLEKLQNKFDSITSFSADFTQSMNGKVNLSGKIFFKEENKLRIETGNTIIVSNGETIWNHNSKHNKVIISEYDESEPSVLSLNKIIYDYPQKCKVTEITKDGKQVLVLVPKEKSNLNFEEAKLYLNSENLVKKIEISGLYNNGLIEIEFSDYKVNQQLADSKFSFQPPEGSTVIDLR